MSNENDCCEVCCAPCVAMKYGNFSIGKVLAIIFVLIPNLIDLVLTILDFKEDIKSYYIIRFIEQGFCILYFISILGELSINYFNNFSVHSYITGFILFGSLVIIIVFETTSLVLFILKYQNIDLLGNIGYYPNLMVSFIQNFHLFLFRG